MIKDDVEHPEMPDCVRAMLDHFTDVMRHLAKQRGVTFKSGAEGIPTILAVRKYYGEVDDGDLG